MIRFGKLNKQERQFYDAYKYNDRVIGWTPEELSAYTGINYYTIQRRNSGIAERGLIGRLKTDGSFADKNTNHKDLMVRNNQCVWRLKGTK